MVKNMPERGRSRWVGRTVPGLRESHSGCTVVGAGALRARAVEEEIRMATDARLCRHYMTSRAFCEGESVL